MASKAQRIKAVVFDLDDTLYPERQYVRSGYRAAAERLRKLTPKDGPFEDWLWGRFLSGRTRDAFDELNEHFKLGLSADKIAELVSVYREHSPEIRPYEGTAGLLGLLHAGYRLGLLSDGFLPAQRLKLQALKIGRFFDAVVFTEEIGRNAWKPSSAGFEAMQKEFGVPHEACAYVGDNPAKDFLAPNQLGWLTIQMVRPGQVHSHKPPPAGGAPQVVATSPRQLTVELLSAR